MILVPSTFGTGMKFNKVSKKGLSGSELTLNPGFHVLFVDLKFPALHQCVRAPQYTDMIADVMDLLVKTMCILTRQTDHH